jgi:tRNA nucleotidyltransferase/poly(A) polymerase
MNEKKMEELLGLVERVATEHGIGDAFYVGGYPRAVVMRSPAADVNDLDVATASMGKATQLAGLVAAEVEGAAHETLHSTMTVRLWIKGEEMDFQGPMPTDETVPHIREADIEVTPLAKNIFGRDFTVNSLAIPVRRRDIVLDLTRRAVDDINDGVIASILPPGEAVPSNPLMITRAVRFAAKYGFRIEDELWSAMKENIGALREQIKPERLAIEAFSLSKHDTGDMLGELGLDDLASEEMISAGEEEAGQEHAIT